jgi:hypothetical protein
MIGRVAKEVAAVVVVDIHVDNILKEDLMLLLHGSVPYLCYPLNRILVVLHSRNIIVNTTKIHLSMSHAGIGITQRR